MGTPYILHVIAWLFLLGKVGPLNDVYRQLSGSPNNLFDVNSMAGMILIEGFLWSPLVFLLLGFQPFQVRAERFLLRGKGGHLLGIFRFKLAKRV